MKTNTLFSSLRTFCLPLMVLLSTLSTQAQVSPEGHYRTENGQIVFNLDACKVIPCELSYQYAKVQVVSGFIDNNGNLKNSSNYPVRIVSTLPIVNVAFEMADSSDILIDKDQRSAVVRGRKTGEVAWLKIADRSKYISQVDFTFLSGYSTPYLVSKVAVSVGSSSSIPDDMRNAAISLIAAYQGISDHLNEFRQIVARDSSDARHLTRLEAQLKSTLKTMVDEQGNPILPVTHRRVTEASRMIMVLSTVLEEIMDKYDFESRILAPLKPSKMALSQLSRQIRTAYGWEEGLAGSGSKALAALSAVLDTELRNMYSLMAAFNNDTSVAQAFNGIFRANSTLYARVNASNAGDVAGASAARDLLAQWNSSTFQNILSMMMSAPKEAQASLQYRILMALTAVESMKDYVDPKGESRINVDLPANVRSKLN